VIGPRGLNIFSLLPNAYDITLQKTTITSNSNLSV